MPRILTLLALLLLPSITLSHSGGLDANGGYHKDGQCHCHKEPCFSRQQVEAATKDAEFSNTAYSRVYDRHDWPHWSDHDGECLNTRQELLQSTSQLSVTFSANGCTVTRGQWYDPFSGKSFTQASDLDIDHGITMAWAFC